MSHFPSLSWTLKPSQAELTSSPPFPPRSAGTYYREGPGKGAKSYGGYANYHRGPAQFHVRIPDGLDHALAAPMLCGGVTVYSPLVQYGAGKEAKDVGIVGIGGLGHFGLRQSLSSCPSSDVETAPEPRSLLPTSRRRN